MVTNLSKGSKGTDVKKLQIALDDGGYYIGAAGADGIYGKDTEAAVKKYQQDNGLDVDGIAGEQTQGSLFGNSGTTNTQKTETTTNNTQTQTSPPDYSDYSYDASTNEAYMNALSALQSAAAEVPKYTGSYDTQIQEIYDKIVNRDKFNYDLNSDALYQQYANQYTNLGKLAMQDTMGQAAAMTGGYGSSYAATAGNQAYQGYLQQLNDVVPELYGMALDQYNQEGDRMLQQYSMLTDMADDEYGKHLDSLDQYWKNISYLKGVADDEYDRGSDNWYTSYELGKAADDTAYARENDDYLKQQDYYAKIKELITGTGYTPSAEELKAAGMSESQAKAYANYYTKQNAPTDYTGNTDNIGNTENIGNDGNNGGNTTVATVPDAIKTKAASFTDNDALNAYLTSQYNAGKIGYEQMGELMLEYEIPSLSDRNWVLTDGGGINWFGGIDNNAKVKDQYGNSYKLNKLVDALVAEGMSKADAKNYVKNLQKQLGA